MTRDDNCVSCGYMGNAIDPTLAHRKRNATHTRLPIINSMLSRSRARSSRRTGIPRRKKDTATSAVDPKIKILPPLSSSAQWMMFGAVLALIILTAWVWSPALHFGFVYDDHLQIESNPEIQSWSHLGRALREPLWAQLGPERASPYYRPFFSFMLFVQYALFGANPLPWHIVSICLHILVVLALFFFLFLHFGRLLPAFSGACVFSCSPLAADVVNWLSACYESAYTLFFLLALCGLRLSRRTSTPRGEFVLRLLSFSALALAILTKETAIVTVMLALAYEFLFLRQRTNHTNLATYLPLVISSTVFLWIHPSLHSADTRSAAQALSTIPYVLLLAFRNLLWPAPVGEFYDLWIDQIHSATSLVLHVAALICIMGAILWWGTKSKLAAWALMTVVLPLSTLAAGTYYFRDYDLFHARYLYLSTAGMAVLIAALVAKTHERSRRQSLAMGAVFLLLCASAWQARAVSQQFRDDTSLFSYAVQMAPHNIIALQLLAETAIARHDCQAAISAYQRAQQWRPDLWKTSFYLGIGYIRCGKTELATGAFGQAIVNGVTSEQAALAWYELGRAQLLQGDSAGALTSLRKAASLDPASRKIQGLLTLILSVDSHR
jgi:Tfp pilus assembly protein PilF